MEKIVKLTPENIATEHICCAIADKKCASGTQAKKDWILSQIADGYVFKKLDVRGKVFIEYVPAENGWVPIEAQGYMLINCFWVSGQFKGKGYGKMLYNECLKDAIEQDKNGIVVVTSAKKQPFLADRKFFELQGFTRCDTAEPYFELWYKPLKEGATPPRFKDCARKGICDNPSGITVYYTDGCPFNEYYVHLLENIAIERGFKIKIAKIESRTQAQNHFVPYTNYGVFRDGKFVTQHILNDNYFGKFIK